MVQKLIRPVALDELVLRSQRALDRAIRLSRRGGRPELAQRRLLIVQIDGLSRAVLEHALKKGRMPFVARLLGEGGYRILAKEEEHAGDLVSLLAELGEPR